MLTPTEFRIRQEGSNVLLFVNGKVVVNLPWDAWLELSREIIAKARQAEQIAKADKVIKDQALLQRYGFPIGVTNNKDMQKEAMNEAAWGSELRRYKPGGLPSQEIVGVPSVYHLPTPKEDSHGRDQS